MKQFRNISTLIFDLGGVLINLEKSNCIKAFHQLGFVNIENYLDNFQHKGIFIALEKGEISTETFISELMKECPHASTHNQIKQAWCAYLLDIPREKLELLVQLRKHFRVIMLSNTNGIHFPFISHTQFEAQGYTIEQCFDKCYLSHELKSAKPDGLVFEKLLAAENTPPNECLFLDDGIKNIEKATEYGIQTYHVSEREDLSFLSNPTTWI
jgi:HAD superfamily hydrolase (TIGR01509 family)